MREASLKRVPVIGTLRVLLVEDSENDAMLLLRELRRGGYKPLSQRVYTPEDMEEALRSADATDGPFEVVIGDNGRTSRPKSPALYLTITDPSKREILG